MDEQLQGLATVFRWLDSHSHEDRVTKFLRVQHMHETWLFAKYNPDAVREVSA